MKSGLLLLLLCFLVSLMLLLHFLFSDFFIYLNKGTMCCLCKYVDDISGVSFKMKYFTKQLNRVSFLFANYITANNTKS